VLLPQKHDEYDFKTVTGPGFWAPMQYLFSSLSPPLLDRFQEAVHLIFGKEGVPSDMISVHIRWGDKFLENALVPIEAYVAAVADMRTRHHLSLKRASVFITTEDQAALVAFQSLAANMYPSWKIYKYLPAIAQNSKEELVHSRGDERDIYYDKLTYGVTSPIAAAEEQGVGAGPSLIALLIALEARFCVLTPSSNWSRIIDELHEWVWSWSRRSRSMPNGRDSERALNKETETETTYLWGEPPPDWWEKMQHDRPAPLDMGTLRQFKLPRTSSKRTTVITTGFNTTAENHAELKKKTKTNATATATSSLLRASLRDEASWVVARNRDSGSRKKLLVEYRDHR